MSHLPRHTSQMQDTPHRTLLASKPGRMLAAKSLYQEQPFGPKNTLTLNTHPKTTSTSNKKHSKKLYSLLYHTLSTFKPPLFITPYISTPTAKPRGPSTGAAALRRFCSSAAGALLTSQAQAETSGVFCWLKSRSSSFCLKA